MTLELSSTAFRQGDPMPEQYTADGRNVSPPLKWGDPPSGTRSFALVCEDPDAPRKMWAHWVIFNLPAESRELSEGVPPQATLPNGATQGVNDFGKVGYGGPAPPPGKPHRYVFKLYALDNPLGLQAGATRDELLTAVAGHVLVEGQLVGIHAR